MNVRRCQAPDVAAVATLLDEATVWVGQRGYEHWPLPFPWEEIAAAIDRGEVYVVESEDGDGVATVSMLPDDPEYWGDQPPDAFYVHKLAVRRDQAGRGIGAAIVEWANAEAAEAGREFLRLDCLGRRRDLGLRLGLSPLFLGSLGRAEELRERPFTHARAAPRH